jgi:C4-dicarboxylate-specific signal transduction histidine kinase
MQKTVTELKTMRSLLMQKEKMASLGEFAASVADEIQEPLSSIHKLSKDSAGIAKQLKQDLPLADKNDNQLSSKADELEKNQQQIQEQTHRADTIVEGLIQRSRSTLGEDSLLI